MKKIIVLALIVLFSFTTNDVKPLQFQFTISETETILKGLSKLPYEESAALIQKIQMVAQKQLTDTTKKK